MLLHSDYRFKTEADEIKENRCKKKKKEMRQK